MEARFQKIDALADLAERYKASHILLAGDTFDAETPSPATRRQAIRAMGRSDAIHWVILPGNHDSLAADELWLTLQQEAPSNVTLALAPEPITLAERVTLLPAPCPARRAGRDLSAWMDSAETPDGHIRVGLAHGGVQSFSEDDATDTIAPDRAARAQLDYLALGDWHGCMQIEPRTWYSGTPESDQFKHDGRGCALVVSLSGAGADPEVETVQTGQFLWQQHTLDLVPGTDRITQLSEQLPAASERRDVLMQIELSGRVSPGDRDALLKALADAEPDFARLVWRETSLAVEYEVDDLDRIDRAGVLRVAADTLYAQVNDPKLSADDQAIARNALNRLYGYVMELA